MRSAPDNLSPAALDTAMGSLLLEALSDADGLDRRLELFVWMHRLASGMLTHQLMVYGSARASGPRLGFEVYYEQPLEPRAVARLIDARDGVVLRLLERWLEAGCRPLHLAPDAQGGAAERELHALGFGHTVVHGVPRAPEAGGAYGLFVFVSLAAPPGAREMRFVRLVVPQLFAAYSRTLALERHPAPGASADAGEADESQPRVTEREAEVLRWVRDGKSNHEIGLILSISPLTVKNHVQKILRKLGANNRAQAVSKAIAMKMLVAPPARRPDGGAGRGFTLLEVLVVLVIIGLLVGVVAPRFFSQVGKSEARVARVQLDALAKALEQYRIDTGRYPSPEQGLAALVKAPEGEARWAGPYLTQAVPHDPWGRPYAYRPNAEGGEIELATLGKDGRAGGQGESEDIVLRR
jgi:general secretion pathway protein G